jgi:hypothetical protein
MAGRKPLSRNFTSQSPAQSNVSPEYILQPTDYTVECETPIGVGGCSAVYMGSYRGSSVAVKCYTIGNAEMNPGKALLLQEAETLLKLQHLNVVKCLGICLQAMHHPRYLSREVLFESHLIYVLFCFKGSLSSVLSFTDIYGPPQYSAMANAALPGHANTPGESGLSGPPVVNMADLHRRVERLLANRENNNINSN